MLTQSAHFELANGSSESYFSGEPTVVPTKVQSNGACRCWALTALFGAAAGLFTIVSWNREIRAERLGDTAELFRTSGRICGDSDIAAVNDFGFHSSLARMMQSGWVFSWSDQAQFRPDLTLPLDVPGSSYYGFSSAGDGSISRVLHGSGTSTLSFGNAETVGSVSIVIDATLYATAMPGQKHEIAVFPFHEGSLLEVRGNDAAIIVLNSLEFDCSSETGVFASFSSMQNAGWMFSWIDHNRFRPILPSLVNVPDSSYYGFSSAGDGVVSLSLHGSGTAKLSFGNAASVDRVVVDVNGSRYGTALPGQTSEVVSFPFQEGSLLQVKQEGKAIIVINDLTIDRSSAVTTVSTSSWSRPPFLPHSSVACGSPDVHALNRFGEGSSAATMERAGWQFSWSDPTFRFRPATLRQSGGLPMPDTSYYGWSYPGDAVLALGLVGAGSATVLFGNPNDSGHVVVVVDTVWKATAFGRDLFHDVTFWFHDGSLLEIRESGNGIIALHSVAFFCGSTTTTTTTTKTTTSTATTTTTISTTSTSTRTTATTTTTASTTTTITTTTASTSTTTTTTTITTATSYTTATTSTATTTTTTATTSTATTITTTTATTSSTTTTTSTASTATTTTTTTTTATTTATTTSTTATTSTTSTATTTTTTTTTATTTTATTSTTTATTTTATTRTTTTTTETTSTTSRTTSTTTTTTATTTTTTTTKTTSTTTTTSVTTATTVTTTTTSVTTATTTTTTVTTAVLLDGGFELDLNLQSVACGDCTLMHEEGNAWGTAGAWSSRDLCRDACISDALRNKCVGFLYPNPGDALHTCRIMKKCADGQTDSDATLANGCWDPTVWNFYYVQS
eukprot:TRINITY_DN1662_c0_g1_i1.p1 TRINITY_DN1662_c0_g1~~TRINITY_DN1662_c0_g1_i1.p1  ORF type:complete len:849 (+),score=117.47 TRINITY_DN1662_c0_g1_i1:123-2669(+)